MYKKPFLLIPIVLIFLSLFVCFAAVNTSSPAERNAALQAAQDKITALIDAKDFAAAQAAIDKIAVDFAGNKLLARRIWEDANRYDKRGAFEYAKTLCARVVADYPTDSYASSYASLLLARLNIYDQISAGDRKAADSAVSKMLNDFAGHSQLVRRAWEVANRYDKFKAFNHSKDLCTQIVAQFPDDLYSSYAALQSAKLDVYKLIEARKYEDANLAVCDIIKDFKGHKQHSRRLYEIAQRFSEKGAKVYARQLHGRIAADYPDDKYGQRAAVQHKKLEAYAQIEANDFEGVRQTVSQMKADFADTDELYAQLDSIGEKYDIIGKADKAKEIFQEIIDSFPADGNPAILASVKARLARYELLIAIETGSNAEVEALIQRLGGKLSAHERLDTFLLTLAETCCSHGNLAKEQGNMVLAIGYFEAALALRERLFIQYPDSQLAAGTCFAAAALLAQELEDYALAVEYFQKVIDDWPGYEHADWAQLKVGIYLEAMVGVNELSIEDGLPLITEAYQTVIDNYPKSEWIALAQRSLERLKKNTD